MDIIHPDDSHAIIAMCGELPKGIEKEYMMRLRMKHRAGVTGKLGVPCLVDMLRFLKIGPPDEKARQKNDVTVWRNITPGTAVDVVQDGTEVRAEFVGLSTGGMLLVRFGGSELINDAPAFACSVAVPDAPDDVDLDSLVVEEEELTARMRELVDSEVPAIEEESEEINNLPLPSLEKDWGAVEIGDTVFMGEDEDREEVKFVAVGPGDFEITVSTEGGNEIQAPESLLEIAGE